MKGRVIEVTICGKNTCPYCRETNRTITYEEKNIIKEPLWACDHPDYVEANPIILLWGKKFPTICPLDLTKEEE